MASDRDRERASHWAYANTNEQHFDRDVSTLAEQFAQVRAEERARCSAICGRLAEMREAGAGECPPGQRLRQAQRMIESDEEARGTRGGINELVLHVMPPMRGGDLRTMGRSDRRGRYAWGGLRLHEGKPS